MIEDYNIILHTDNKDILKSLIKSDLYGFGNDSVGLSSYDKNKDREAWRDFVSKYKTKTALKNHKTEPK